jgi:hypothetical protein
LLESKGFQVVADAQRNVRYLHPGTPSCSIWLYSDNEWSTADNVPAECKSLEDYLNWYEQQRAEIASLLRRG